MATAAPQLRARASKEASGVSHDFATRLQPHTERDDMGENDGHDTPDWVKGAAAVITLVLALLAVARLFH
jgi:type VI protein secretion system component VasF